MSESVCSNPDMLPCFSTLKLYFSFHTVSHFHHHQRSSTAHCIGIDQILSGTRKEISKRSHRCHVCCSIFLVSLVPQDSFSRGIRWCVRSGAGCLCWYREHGGRRRRRRQQNQKVTPLFWVMFFSMLQYIALTHHIILLLLLSLTALVVHTNHVGIHTIVAFY